MLWGHKDHSRSSVTGGNGLNDFGNKKNTAIINILGKLEGTLRESSRSKFIKTMSREGKMTDKEFWLDNREHGQ